MALSSLRYVECGEQQGINPSSSFTLHLSYNLVAA